MLYMKNLWLLVYALYGLCSCLMGQDANPFDPDFKPEPEPTYTFRVQAEFIEMPKENLIKLMSDSPVTADDTKLRASVGELLETGTAKMLEIMFTSGVQTVKQISESRTEYIYPTEYEPGEIPMEIPKEITELVKLDLSKLQTGPHPTAFEARFLGPYIETTCWCDEDTGIIKIEAKAEIDYYVGTKVWTEWKNNLGDSSIKMPILYRAAFETKAEMSSGKPLFVTALTPKGDDGVPVQDRKIMVFLRCDKLLVPIK